MRKSLCSHLIGEDTESPETLKWHVAEGTLECHSSDSKTSRVKHAAR